MSHPDDHHALCALGDEFRKRLADEGLPHRVSVTSEHNCDREGNSYCEITLTVSVSIYRDGEDEGEAPEPDEGGDTHVPVDEGGTKPLPE